MKNTLIIVFFLVVFLEFGNTCSAQVSGGASDWIVGVVSSLGTGIEPAVKKTDGSTVKKPEEYTGEDIKETKTITNSEGLPSQQITFKDGAKQEIITRESGVETITTSSDGLSRLSVVKNNDGSSSETKTTLTVGKKTIQISTTVSSKDTSGNELATTTKNTEIPR